MENDDEISLFEGELWNGAVELSLGGVELTATMVQHIIRRRLDRFPVEEIHLCDVSFVNNRAFQSLVMALQDLPTLERLTWHSPLTLSQWAFLVNGWEIRQLVDLDIEWKVLSASDVDEEESDNDVEEDDEGRDNSQREETDEEEMIEEIFYGFVFMTAESLVVRMEGEEESRSIAEAVDCNILQAFDTGLREQRLQQLQQEARSDLAISLHVNFQNSETFALWSRKICSQPSTLSSLKVQGMDFTIQSIPVLTQLVNAGKLMNLSLVDCSVSGSLLLSSPLLRAFTDALASNTSLQRLAFCSVETPGHVLWSAVFGSLRENTKIEHLHLTSSDLEDLADLVAPLIPHLPYMRNVRTLQTRWCEDLGHVLLPGLQNNLYLHDLILDGLRSYAPANDEIAIIQGILDRNRLYHEMKSLSYDKDEADEFFDTIEYLANDDLARSGTSLYSIVRCTLLPHLVTSHTNGKRKRSEKQR